MNVSFTRARCKLVIFGSRKTLQREPLLEQFFDLMEGQGWILALPAGADVAHARVFDGCSTPAKRRFGVSGMTTGKENRVGQAVKRTKRSKY